MRNRSRAAVLNLQIFLSQLFGLTRVSSFLTVGPENRSRELCRMGLFLNVRFQIASFIDSQFFRVLS